MSHSKVNNLYLLKGSAGDIGYFDMRCFPMSVINYVGPVFTEALLDQAFALRAHVSQCAFEAGTQHFVVVCLDHIGVPSATTRKKTADYMKKDKDEVGYKGLISVISNPLFRGALTAIAWMSKNEGAAPQIWAKNFEEGISKALEIFQESGLAVPNIDPHTYSFPAPAEFAAVKPGLQF